VTADAAVFVDDNPASCAGAAALGIGAVQIGRDAADGKVAGTTADGKVASTTVVRSLTEVEAMLWA